MDMPTIESLTASPARTVGYHLNRVNTAIDGGVARTRTSGGTAQAGGYVGASAQVTFSKQTASLQERIEAGEDVQLALGQTYSAHPYRPVGDSQPGYDQVYGDRDYSGAVDTVPSLGRTLEESYGDVDNDIPEQKETFEDDIDPYGSAFTQDAEQRKQSTRTDIDPESLDEVYRTGVSSRYVRSADEILSLLREAQSNLRVPTEEDTEGIRGVYDGIIEPVI
jgi:hypothetical protein